MRCVSRPSGASQLLIAESTIQVRFLVLLDISPPADLENIFQLRAFLQVIPFCIYCDHGAGIPCCTDSPWVLSDDGMEPFMGELISRLSRPPLNDLQRPANQTAVRPTALSTPRYGTELPRPVKMSNFLVPTEPHLQKSSTELRFSPFQGPSIIETFHSHLRRSNNL